MAPVSVFCFCPSKKKTFVCMHADTLTTEKRGCGGRAHVRDTLNVIVCISGVPCWHVWWLGGCVTCTSVQCVLSADSGAHVGYVSIHSRTHALTYSFLLLTHTHTFSCVRALSFPSHSLSPLPLPPSPPLSLSPHSPTRSLPLSRLFLVLALMRWNMSPPPTPTTPTPSTTPPTTTSPTTSATSTTSTLAGTQPASPAPLHLETQVAQVLLEVRVCARVHVCACAHACVRAWMHGCMHGCVHA